ncbi:MAG: hypothetical protein V2I66_05025 [Halieaceae bacterium]|jgi:hypothetical protein|nr:hypothetical protein [Halieaceae bacterium]
MHKILAPMLLIAGSIAAFPGCSNKAVYEAVQQSNKHECEKNQESVRERCMEQLGESYEDYERSRQEILDSKP